MPSNFTCTQMILEHVLYTTELFSMACTIHFEMIAEQIEKSTPPCPPSYSPYVNVLPIEHFSIYAMLMYANLF